MEVKKIGFLQGNACLGNSSKLLEVTLFEPLCRFEIDAVNYFMLWVVKRANSKQGLLKISCFPQLHSIGGSCNLNFSLPQPTTLLFD